MTQKENLREIVLDMLLEVTRQNRPSHLVHAQMLAKYQYLPKQERAFISRLFKGTLERMITLDYVTEQFSAVKLSKIKPVIKNILRMSIYQMMEMPHVPVSAVCNEAVKLAKKRGFKNLSGYVNGVLRAVSRDLEHISWPDRQKDPVRYLGVTGSVPEWLARFLLDTYGMETACRIVQDGFKEKPVTVRCCEEEHVDETRIRLEQEGVQVSAGTYLPYALKLSGMDYLGGLQSFLDGAYAVMDESSMMVTELADPAPGDLVLDLCAAPGGKCCHAAERVRTDKLHVTASLPGSESESSLIPGKLAEGPGRSSGFVIARDISEQKTELIQENAARLGITNIRTEIRDAGKFYAEDARIADVVYADLPCSGLGVIGRKPDIKYHMTPEQMPKLAQMQREILSVAQEYVKPGGKLVYSTCTINPAENEQNAEWFAGQFDFTLLTQRQFLQGVDDCDGFYIAVFQRNQP